MRACLYMGLTHPFVNEIGNTIKIQGTIKATESQRSNHTITSPPMYILVRCRLTCACMALFGSIPPRRCARSPTVSLILRAELSPPWFPVSLTVRSRRSTLPTLPIPLQSFLAGPPPGLGTTYIPLSSQGVRPPRRLRRRHRAHVCLFFSTSFGQVSSGAFPILTIFPSGSSDITPAVRPPSFRPPPPTNHGSRLR